MSGEFSSANSLRKVAIDSVLVSGLRVEYRARN